MYVNDDALILWSLFRQGDWQAYSALYNMHFKLLNNYGCKFTNDVNLIEDAVHDLFIKLWTNRKTIGNTPSVKNYLYKSLRNTIFRKLQSKSRFTDIIDNEYPFSFEVSYDQVIIENEDDLALQKKIKSAIDTLPPRQQEIIFLRFYEGLSYDEVADIMAINISSSYKLLYKALANLEQILDMPKTLIITAIYFAVEAKVHSL